MKKQSGIVFLWLITGMFASGQTRTIKLDEAIQLGIQNSRQLKLSQQKIDEALTKVEQARQLTLPTAKWSAGYSHALMLAKKFNFPSTGGQAPKALEFPFDLTLYQSTLSISEPIFAGNQIRYAKQSADLLVKMSRLDSDKDKDEAVYTIIDAYINYYKIQQSQKVAAQNLEDVDSRLTEIRKYETQGLATRNDVLRFQVQKSNIQLTVFELESNRKIANYSLNILLGLPDSTGLKVEDLSHELDLNIPFEDWLRQALTDRKELGSFVYQNQLDSMDIKKIRDGKLPTLGLGGSLYYINPSKDFIPKSGSFLAPFVIGLNLSWDISSLYKTRQKLQEAKIQQQELATKRDAFTDAIKTEVYADYMKYQQALQRIGVLEESVVEATENERIMLSKFRNNLATTADQIDALTILYGQRISLELAKADATLAYYNLLNATGHIQPQTH
jgi:outer membrane protein